MSDETRKSLRLFLADEEWPKQTITHTRTIARAIAFDDQENYYFVRTERDDIFGKAVLIETSGGGVEAQEDLEEALKRELKEELGAEAEVLCFLGTAEDDYNVLGRHNITHYFLCRITRIGRRHLTRDERESFHLSTLKLSYEEALQEYERCRCTAIGRLIANREVPVLCYAKSLLEQPSDNDVPLFRKTEEL